LPASGARSMLDGSAWASRSPFQIEGMASLSNLRLPHARFSLPISFGRRERRGRLRTIRITPTTEASENQPEGWLRYARFCRAMSQPDEDVRFVEPRSDAPPRYFGPGTEARAGPRFITGWTEAASSHSAFAMPNVARMNCRTRYLLRAPRSL